MKNLTDSTNKTSNNTIGEEELYEILGDNTVYQFRIEDAKVTADKTEIWILISVLDNRCGKFSEVTYSFKTGGKEDIHLSAFYKKLGIDGDPYTEYQKIVGKRFCGFMRSLLFVDEPFTVL